LKDTKKKLDMPFMHRTIQDSGAGTTIFVLDSGFHGDALVHMIDSLKTRSE
jgi:hypothetical protein